MGADHTAGYTIATNILKVGGFVDPLQKEGQVELSRNLQIASAVVDSTGMCIFVAFPALDIPECLPALIDMINAVYGIDLSGDDVTELGKTVLKLDAFAKIHEMAKQRFRPTRRSGFSGVKAYIWYVEVLKKCCNAVGRTFCDAIRIGRR